MTTPLEIAIKYGEKHHTIIIDAGDGDAASEAKERVGFILDLYAGGADAKRRLPKPVVPPVQKPSTLGAEKPIGGGVK
jgi:hypothetical protein